MKCVDWSIVVGLLCLAASLTVSAVVLGVAERQAHFDHGAPLFFIWHRCNVGLLASLVGVTILLLWSDRNCFFGITLLWIVCLGNVLTLLWGWAMMFLIAQLADTIYVLTPAACALNTVALVCATAAWFKMKEPASPQQLPLPDVSV